MTDGNNHNSDRDCHDYGDSCMSLNIDKTSVNFDDDIIMANNSEFDCYWSLYRV